VRVDRVELWVDGALKQTDNVSPYNFDWDARPLPDGDHTLEARAFDPSGNTASSGVLTVTVSNPATLSNDVVLYAAEAPVRVGSWAVVTDATAAGGQRIYQPNAGVAKITTPSATPAHYFEMTFNAEAGIGYRLWLRGKADNNDWANDSVFAQFSGSTTQAGAATFRIGTTSGTAVNLEDCSGCGLSGWGWQDNGWGGNVFGPLIYFATSGTQTIRIQAREDGFSIDQIVLSPANYVDSAPGALKNDNTILPKP
jgi:Bacterial Ig domain